MSGSSFLDLDKEISAYDVSCLNKLLVSDCLGLDDKRNVFVIGNFLKGDIVVDGVKVSGLEYVMNFCLCDSINKNNIFSPLLYKIREEIGQVLNDKEKNKDDIEFCKIKFFTLFFVGVKAKDFDGLELGSILIKILNSNISFKNYDFIRYLFSNDIMKNNIEKLKVVLMVIFENIEINTNDYEGIVKILSNNNVLALDNMGYRKLVSALFSCGDGYRYLFEMVMNHPDLTSNKRRYAIDYYCWLIGRGTYNYSLSLIKMLMMEEDINIFNVICSERFILLDDDCYLKLLNDLSTCKNIFSCVKVLGNLELDDEKRELALSFIEKGKFGLNKNNFRKDYKNDVAMAATSVVLRNCSLENYIKILSLINGWCEEFEEMYLGGKIDRRLLYGSVSKGVVRLLNCSWFGDNMSRLYMIIDTLLGTKTSEFLMNELVNFCCSKESCCYTDEEYVRVLQIINDLYDKGLYDVASLLFTNKNVLFMNDRSVLFEVIQTGNRKAIEDLTCELNRTGYYNLNCCCLFDGVNDEDLSIITGNGFSRVKRFN